MCVSLKAFVYLILISLHSLALANEDQSHLNTSVKLTHFILDEANKNAQPNFQQFLYKLKNASLNKNLKYQISSNLNAQAKCQNQVAAIANKSKNTITICQLFFNISVLEQIQTLIHEYTHLLGYGECDALFMEYVIIHFAGFKFLRNPEYEAENNCELTQSLPANDGKILPGHESLF